MSTWADVKKGDSVRMGGKVFEVAKAKRKGKKVDVVLAGHGGRFASTVKAKADVDLVTPTGKGGKGIDFARLGKLHGGDGAQTRWASKAEEREAARPILSPGDPSIVEPPKTNGPKWKAPPAGDAEAAIVVELGGELIAEGDPAEGYYVPPVDVETVHAHLVLFHGREALPGSVVTALAEHDEEHRAAAAGKALLPINHWHTKRRAQP